MVGLGRCVSSRHRSSDNKEPKTVAHRTVRIWAASAALIGFGVSSCDSTEPTQNTPVSLVALGSTSVTGTAGLPVASLPTIEIRDEAGQPISGVRFQVVVLSGGGSVTGTPSQTISGSTSIGTWTLGPTVGQQQIRVQSGSLAPVTITATASAAVPFRVEVRFLGTVPAAVQNAANLAATRIGQVITGDIPNQPANVNLNGCAPGAGIVNETVDDIVVYIRRDTLDGPGNVLAQAGPCTPLRAASPFHPFYGTMLVDSADIASMAANGTLNNVILHELFHTVGIGTMWAPSPNAPQLTNRIQFVTPSDPVFTGADARAAYVASSGDAPTGVPVESGGGAGTAGQHWRETTLATELMTGYADPGVPNPLSIISIASLRDLGYTATDAAADPFTVPVGQLRALRSGSAISFGNDVIIGVLRAPDGSPFRPPPEKSTRE